MSDFERRRMRVYIAGPISKGDTQENIRQGLEWGRTMLRDGLAPFIPHLDTFLGLDPGIKPGQPGSEWNGLVSADTEVVTPRGGGASHARPVGKFYTYCGRDTHGGWKVLPLPAPVVCIRCKKAGAPRWVEGPKDLGQPGSEWNGLLEWDLEWVAVSEALFRIPGESKGADLEVRVARSLVIPVFHSYPLLLEWAAARGLRGKRRLTV